MPVPEEILERILELVFFPNSQPSLSETRATHVLLVCKTFERIALPFMYSSLRLRTREQADKLAATLAKRPALGECVRALYVESPACGTAFSVVVNTMDARLRPLDVLDIKLDSTRDEELEQEAFDQFCGALRRCPDAKALVVRKSGYLTHDKTVRAVADLASGVRMCSSVVSGIFHSCRVDGQALSKVWQPCDLSARAWVALPCWRWLFYGCFFSNMMSAWEEHDMSIYVAQPKTQGTQTIAKSFRLKDGRLSTWLRQELHFFDKNLSLNGYHFHAFTRWAISI